MSLNHNIDAQSVYGFDTMPQIRSNSNPKLLDDTEPEFKIPVKETEIELNLIEAARQKSRAQSLTSEPSPDLSNKILISSQNSSPRTKRWFESGSTSTVDLGSCRMFDEPIDSNTKNGSFLSLFKFSGNDRRRRSLMLFKSFRYKNQNHRHAKSLFIT